MVEIVQVAQRILHPSDNNVQTSDTNANDWQSKKTTLTPAPLFDDKQYKHIFRITKQMTQHVLNICAITDPFSTSQQDVSGRYNIDPLVKVLLMAR
jgi:ethanolamine utilization protein EutP (predicted NTPase)